MGILSKEKGQSLIEVLAALAVALVVILGLVRVTISSMTNARYAKDQSLATQYAQEAMEEVRAYRDQNSWETFWSDKVPSTEGPTAIEDTIFSKTVTYENVETSLGAEDRAEITATITWSDGAKTHESKLTSYLTKWE
jgi:Tfp pilus assembly protein PilV